MKNEEIVKAKYHKAVVEKYTTRGSDVRTYFLIWDSYIRGDRRRLGEGDTEAQAWKNAKEWIDLEQCLI